jgi:hypothetical protein
VLVQLYIVELVNNILYYRPAQEEAGLDANLPGTKGSVLDWPWC